MTLKAPFPYFGGKSTVAPEIWQALGQPKHYIEPFCGSAAVLLARPDYNPSKHMETICDKDGFVANAWRGMQFAPDEVARYCDWPVNHADLNARRKYLNDNSDFLLKLCDDPEYFDAKIAGYWVWAMSCWIGSGLVRPKAMPDVTNAKGCHKTGLCRRPTYGASGAHGVHKVSLVDEEPGPALDVRDPYTPGLYTWFRELSERLRRVRVVCGDWTRVCGGDWQDDRGTCGIFFDPPYDPEKCNRDPKIYTEESATVAAEVREWCIPRGERKTYRIVLAGYYEEHQSLEDDGWTVHRWSAHGGFANRGKGKTRGEENRHKEALFFSPHCHSSGLRKYFEVS
jgi:DNA adenine methylase